MTAQQFSYICPDYESTGLPSRCIDSVTHCPEYPLLTFTNMETDLGNTSGVRDNAEETSDVWSELFRTVATLNDAVELSLQASGADAATDKVITLDVGVITVIGLEHAGNFAPILSHAPPTSGCFGDHQEEARTKVGADHAAEQGGAAGTRLTVSRTKQPSLTS